MQGENQAKPLLESALLVLVLLTGSLMACIAVAESAESEIDSTTAWLVSTASIVAQALVVIGIVLLVTLYRGATRRGARKPK